MSSWGGCTPPPPRLFLGGVFLPPWGCMSHTPLPPPPPVPQMQRDNQLYTR
jgi:hypothetical protein